MATTFRKNVFLSTLATGLFAQATTGLAQNTHSGAKSHVLEAEIARLNTQISSLHRGGDILEIAAKDIGSTPSKGYKVGDTTLKFSGLIDLDIHFTETSDGEISPTAAGGGGLDFYIPSLTPVGDGRSSDGSLQTDFTAQSSRFALSTTTPSAAGDINTHVELDFLLGPGGNELVSNSFNPRLRRAYIDFRGWRIGQEWSTFQGLHAIPESASFYTPGESQVFVRQPIIRYTLGNYQFAAENPQTFIQNPPDGAATIGDDGLLPDLIARYNFTGDYGIVSVSGIARQLAVETESIDESVLGLGVSVAGRVKVGSTEDDVRFSFQAGDGLGRYVGLGILRDAQFNADTGDFDAIGAISGNVAYRHVRGEWSTNVGYSFIDIDLDEGNSANLTETQRSQSAYVAVVKKVAPKLSVAGEFLAGERELVNGDDGSISRFTFSVKQAF